VARQLLLILFALAFAHKEFPMIAKQITTAIGVFSDARQAQEAVRALKQAGFRDDQIGLASPHPEEGAQVRAAHAAEGATAGVVTGAGAGALWALGIAAGVLPGVGPVVAGGLLTSVLASAVGGAVVAGLAGTLIGLGISEEDARYYEGEFLAGRTIVSVQAEGRAAEAWAILERCAASRSAKESRDANA
jgi:hypothetical protein